MLNRLFRVAAEAVVYSYIQLGERRFNIKGFDNSGREGLILACGPLLSTNHFLSLFSISHLSLPMVEIRAKSLKNISKKIVCPS